MLNLEEVDVQKYSAYFLTSLLDKHQKYVLLENSKVGLSMCIDCKGMSLATMQERDAIEGEEIFFKEITFSSKPSKYLVSVLIEWFCQLTEIPTHLISFIDRWAEGKSKYQKYVKGTKLNL